MPVDAASPAVLLATPDTRRTRKNACRAHRSAPRGPGSDEQSVIRSLISPKSQERITKALDLAVADGAALILGGTVPGGVGSYFEPTLIGDVRPGMRILGEETLRARARRHGGSGLGRGDRRRESQ